MQTQALQREIDEELQFHLVPDKLKFIAKRTHRYPTKEIQLFLYMFEVPSENITFMLSDHDQYQWVSAAEMNHVHFSPADLLLLPEITQFVF